MNESANGKNKALIGLVVVALLAVAATAVFIASANEQANPIASQNGTSGNNSVQNVTRGDYDDGEYSARGSYITPGGNESIDLSVTLRDNMITEAGITQNAISNEARQFQAKFASGFRPIVIGKNIDEVDLSRVAGSSLTPIGFNNALDEIKDEARA